MTVMKGSMHSLPNMHNCLTSVKNQDHRFIAGPDAGGMINQQMTSVYP